jgi:hypothetical protein
LPFGQNSKVRCRNPEAWGKRGEPAKEEAERAFPRSSDRRSAMGDGVKGGLGFLGVRVARRCDPRNGRTLADDARDPRSGRNRFRPRSADSSFSQHKAYREKVRTATISSGGDFLRTSLPADILSSAAKAVRRVERPDRTAGCRSALE